MQLRNNLDFFSPDEQTLKKKKTEFQNSLPSKLTPNSFCRMQQNFGDQGQLGFDFVCFFVFVI